MRKNMMRVCVAVTVAAVLSTLGAAVPSAVGPLTKAPRLVQVTFAGSSQVLASPGEQLWVKRYPHGIAVSVAVSPGGGTVFVTGQSAGAYATVAYDAATGALVWVKRHPHGVATSLAVSPTGSTVYVTGTAGGYGTVAYDAATGAQLWAQDYSGPANSASSVAVSPTGGTVFVTGSSGGARSISVYGTVAYDAATGHRLWVARYSGPGNGEDGASSVAVSPTGDTVFVTGSSAGANSELDYATIAYDAATGAQLWVKRYNGLGVSPEGTGASSVAVSPAGGTVFVTGHSIGVHSYDYATIAYNAATGNRLWLKRYNGPGNSADYASSVAVSPTGDTVFVTGQSAGVSSYGYGTVAYDAATGAQLWVARYNGAGSDNYANSVAVSPDGSTVFVTGESDTASFVPQYATVAYNAATGAQLWVKRHPQGAASSMAVSPAGHRLFVTGYSTGAGSGNDYTTVAYSG